MIKFTKLNKLKAIAACIIFSKYLLWCLFFILQGKAIDYAIKKNAILNEIIYILLSYILVKILVMLCDVLQKFLIEYYKNIEVKQQWIVHMPNDIYRDNLNSKNLINVLFFDYLPRIFELEVFLLTNTVTILTVLIMTFFVFIYTKFLLGIIALLCVFALNYFSKNIYVNKIDDYAKKSYENKIKLLNWVEQYFNSFREIAKNWRSILDSNWKTKVYENYFTSKKSEIKFYLYRDLLSQLLIEFPFLLNTALVTISVYYDKISVTQLFVWVGFSQFIINASNAYLENKIYKKQLITLNKQTSTILKNFTIETLTPNINKHIDVFSSYEAIMKDGIKNQLSLKPGLYHIKGNNGSGKSTLMNLLLNYERKEFDFQNKNLLNFFASITQTQVRVIDRDAIIFEDLLSFNNQICGPNSTNKSWKSLIFNALNSLTDAKLTNHWMQAFTTLEHKYLNRANKIMSSGEKILLSFMRFLSSWNEKVYLLIIDECDTFLDIETRKIFNLTLDKIAAHMAIYISRHQE